jgi:dephospho-CoA kinase
VTSSSRDITVEPSAPNTPKNARPFRVALTGGIASGKSTVADLFVARGAALIDTDVIAREVVEPGRPALAHVVEAFGGLNVLGPDGRLDRPRLRERIFSNPAARRTLEGILHPAIREEMERQSAALADASPYQVLAIPLLTEGGRRDHVDRVLVVDAPEHLQVQRLVARDGVTEAQALAALRAQATREARLALADDVIVNSGSVDDLASQVARLHEKYLALAAATATSGPPAGSANSRPSPAPQ